MKWSRLRMRTTKGLIRWAERRSPVTISACLIHHPALRKYFLCLLSLIHMCARDSQNKNNLITSLRSVRVLLSHLILPQLIYFPSSASCRLGKRTECQFWLQFKFWCIFFLWEHRNLGQMKTKNDSQRNDEPFHSPCLRSLASPSWLGI